MSSITGLLADVHGGLIVADVARSNGSHLASMYAHIGCRTVDVVSVDTQAGAIDVWIDDEGAYTAAQNVVVSAIVSSLARRTVPIFGKALLLASNAEGESIGLAGEQRRLMTDVHRLVLGLPGIQEDIAAAEFDATLTGRY